MCIDSIELFFIMFLIFLHLKIQLSWKVILHQLVNTILTFQNNYTLYLATKNSFITDSTIELKQYLKDVALRTVPY